MRAYNVPVFIPHEGCPHGCVFCNQRKITGADTSMTPCAAAGLIGEQLDRLPTGEKRIEAAFFGGSFTGLPLELQKRFYDAANQYRGRIQGIRLSTRPDYITPEVLKLAADSGVTMIELGAQSADDTVLAQNGRGHTFAQTCAAAEQIRAAGIGLGLQMMTGMFGSDPETDVKTAEALAGLEPDCARIYPTLVLRDTALAALYQQGHYCPQSLEAAIETAKAALVRFRRRGIPVIRLGLHAGEDLREPGTVIAGPFHPAFGELVESRIWRDRIESQIACAGQADGTVEIQVPRGELSKAVGHKRCNRRYFQQKYGIEVKYIEQDI